MDIDVFNTVILYFCHFGIPLDVVIMGSVKMEHDFEPFEAQAVVLMPKCHTVSDYQWHPGKENL